MNVVSGLRVSDEMMVKVTMLWKRLRKDKELAVLTDVTRSVVMRLAIYKGIDAMSRDREDWMLDNVGCYGAASGTDKRHISLSVPVWLLDSAQKLADLDTSGKTKRTHVLRCALRCGIERLEREEQWRLEREEQLRRANIFQGLPTDTRTEA